MPPDADGERTELAGGKLVLDHPAPAVARLTISNPERRNALDHDILNALAETMPKLDRGIEIRCVVITGDGDLFSAGYDIAGIPDDTFSTDAEALVRRWRRSARIGTPCSPRSTAIAWAAGSSWRFAATSACAR
jgi:enoyl-CoA hydratase/carnithine racemase